MLLVALLLLRGLFSVAYTVSIPLGEAPDEADHYAYAAYIITEGSLPSGPEMTQAKHPPLYHIIAAVVGKLAGGTGDFSFLRANPDVGLGPDALAPNFFIHTTLEDWPWRDGVLAMRAGRSVSVLAGLVLVLATYLLGRAIWPGRPVLAFGGAVFTAFLPESLFIGGAMNNDLLAAMWATLAMWLAVSRPQHILKMLLTGTCLGFAFVTKASTGSLALVIAAAMFVGGYVDSIHRLPRKKILARSAVHVIIAGTAALAIATPWLWRNWTLHGDLLGWPVVLATIDQRSGPLTLTDTAHLLRGWWFSFWGKFGGAGHVPLPTIFYVIWAVLGVIALTGWMLGLLRNKRGAPLALTAPVPGWIVLFGAPCVTAAGIYSYSQVALGTDQGRLLFPALGPIALLLVTGLMSWIPQRLERAACFVLAVGMAFIGIGALQLGLFEVYTPPPPPEPERVFAAQPINMSFGPLELLSFYWAESDRCPLTLYWRATEETSEDLRTAIRLYDAQDNLLWEWKRSPGAGRLSTDRWTVGRIVTDVYCPPPETVTVTARWEVGLRPFPEGPWIPVANNSSNQLLSIPK